MHEVSLMVSILSAVENAARECGMTQVFTVKLVIGSDRWVLPDALRFAFDQLKRDPLTPDSLLEIEEVTGRDLLIESFEGE